MPKDRTGFQHDTPEAGVAVPSALVPAIALFVAGCAGGPTTIGIDTEPRGAPRPALPEARLYDMPVVELPDGAAEVQRLLAAANIVGGLWRIAIDDSDWRGHESIALGTRWMAGEEQGSRREGAQSEGAQSEGAQSVGAQSEGAQSEGAQSEGAQSVGAQRTPDPRSRVKTSRCSAVGRVRTSNGSAPDTRRTTRFLVIVARSPSRVRKLCTGRPSAVRLLRAFSLAASETCAGATMEVRAASAAAGSWSSNSSGLSRWRMCHST